MDWHGEDPSTEEILKELKVTIRCIPLDGQSDPGTCQFTGQHSQQRVVFGKANELLKQLLC